MQRTEKMKKSLTEDEIQILGQTHMHPRNRLEMADEIKHIKKEQKEEDEVEIAMQVNNQNKLKQADKILKDNTEKEIDVLEDSI